MTKPANDNSGNAHDVQELAVHLEAIRREFPELADDETLQADTFEGMGLNDLLARLLDASQDARHIAAAIADRIGELRQRQERFSRKQDAMRALMLRLLTGAGQQRVQLPEGTLSVSKGAERQAVTETLTVRVA